MNDAIVKSYFRSVQRGTRTMEHVPEELREEVMRLYDAWMCSRVETKKPVQD